MHRFIPDSEERVGRRHVRSGGRNPVHTIDARQAYGRRTSLATAVRLLSRVQRRQILDRRLREDHHAGHEPERDRAPLAHSRGGPHPKPDAAARRPRGLPVETGSVRRFRLRRRPNPRCRTPESRRQPHRPRPRGSEPRSRATPSGFAPVARRDSRGLGAPGRRQPSQRCGIRAVPHRGQKRVGLRSPGCRPTISRSLRTSAPEIPTRRPDQFRPGQFQPSRSRPSRSRPSRSRPGRSRPGMLRHTLGSGWPVDLGDARGPGLGQIANRGPRTGRQCRRTRSSRRTVRRVPAHTGFRRIASRVAGRAG